MAYNKINFTNGSGEPINAENLNKIQEQYTLGVAEAVNIKESQEYPAVVRSDIYDKSQALDGELYIITNPNGEYDSTQDNTNSTTETEEVGGDV